MRNGKETEDDEVVLINTTQSIKEEPVLCHSVLKVKSALCVTGKYGVTNKLG